MIDGLETLAAAVEWMRTHVRLEWIQMSYEYRCHQGITVFEGLVEDEVEGMNDAMVSAYASLFVHRWDSYAVQQRNGGYWRVAEPLTLEHLEAHLQGRWTLGTYVLDAQSTCTFAVFDDDSDDGIDGWRCWRSNWQEKGLQHCMRQVGGGRICGFTLRLRLLHLWFVHGCCPMHMPMELSSIPNKKPLQLVGRGRLFACH